jgi:hypothetical protein
MLELGGEERIVFRKVSRSVEDSFRQMSKPVTVMLEEKQLWAGDPSCNGNGFSALRAPGL